MNLIFHDLNDLYLIKNILYLLPLKYKILLLNKFLFHLMKTEETLKVNLYRFQQLFFYLRIMFLNH